MPEPFPQLQHLLLVIESVSVVQGGKSLELLLIQWIEVCSKGCLGMERDHIESRVGHISLPLLPVMHDALFQQVHLAQGDSCPDGAVQAEVCVYWSPKSAVTCMGT